MNIANSHNVYKLLLIWPKESLETMKKEMGNMKKRQVE
jgi:hypothetical protein